ncbi:MAG TPA: hypothetical protein VEU09_08205 [Candidatus Binatia bacterium]|nr:hypothetical protein [Candidatus Binatia bacterium]
MSPGQRDDYVLRQVRAIAAILARIIGLRLDGEPEQARAGLEEAYTMLLGSQAPLIRRVDTSTAAKLIGSSEKTLSFAGLIEEEAEQEKDEGRSALLRARAADLRLQVEQKEPR